MSLSSVSRPAVRRAINASSSSTGGRGSVAVFASPQCHQRTFSTTPELSERRSRRDNNKMRGMSAIYGSKIRKRMQLGPDEIGRPVVGFRPEVETDPDHGLWQFFYENKNSLLKRDEIEAHGRAWTADELRKKSWEDLHKLWWTCLKEKNRLSTLEAEFERQELQIGAEAIESRIKVVQKTMTAIKFVLTERYYSWEDARLLAEQDPEIDLTSTTNPYTPIDYLESEPEVEVEAIEDTSEGGAKVIDPAVIPAEAGEPVKPPRV